MFRQERARRFCNDILNSVRCLSTSGLCGVRLLFVWLPFVLSRHLQLMYLPLALRLGSCRFGRSLNVIRGSRLGKAIAVVVAACPCGVQCPVFEIVPGAVTTKADLYIQGALSLCIRVHGTRRTRSRVMVSALVCIAVVLKIVGVAARSRVGHCNCLHRRRSENRWVRSSHSCSWSLHLSASPSLASR